MASNFDRKLRLPRIHFRVLLHAVNMRHGRNGFSSLPKEGVLRIFSPWEIRRLRSGLYPQTWVPKASTLPVDWQWFPSDCTLLWHIAGNQFGPDANMNRAVTRLQLLHHDTGITVGQLVTSQCDYVETWCVPSNTCLTYRVCINYRRILPNHIFTNTEQKYMMLLPFERGVFAVS